MVIVMKTVSKAQFKSHLLEYLRLIEETKQPLIVSHAGKPTIKVSAFKEDPDAILKKLRGSVISYGDLIEPTGEEWEAMK